jgi:phenylpropionate dioxygenase-like ring-hydroxylating dioxygenase large terminal subunit
MLTAAVNPTLQGDLLPAGGPDPLRFDPKEAWYPIFYLEDLEPSKPQKFTLLDQDLVIWWDRQAQVWRAFADQCPHRLAPLSQGRIAADGLLECPYHGWAFQGDGRCDRIPQQPYGQQSHQSQRAAVAAMPTALAQGLLFVYPGQPENAARVELPLLEPIAATPEQWICLNTFRDLPYNAHTLLENVLDSSHVPFTHHRSVGNRANAAPVELELLAADRQGFQGYWAEGPRKGTLGAQTTRFIAPALMWHDLTSQQFGRTLTVVYATPIRKGECRLFARFPFKFSSRLPGFLIQLTPRWYSHLSNNNILEDDQIFLHYQERYLAAKGGSANFATACYLPTRADLFASAFRTWVNGYGADPFPGQPLPPSPSSTVLLDRYHSHTVHCVPCRNALKNIQRLRGGMVLLAAIAASSLPMLCLGRGQLFPLLNVLAAIGLCSAIAVWTGLGKLERQFLQGQPIPARNRPEKP